MTPDDFRRLAAAGLSTEQIAIVMEMMERDALAHAEAEEARKEKARSRVAKWRERHRDVTETSAKVTERLAGGDARVEDKTSNSEIEPQEENKKRATSALIGFDTWYRVYPHKVQRGAAERAFPKALALAGSVEALIAGTQRYIASKPTDRPWQNPATWLNGKGWLDEPGTVQPRDGPASVNGAPTMAQIFGMVKDRTAEHGQKREDSGGVREAVRDLPLLGRAQ